MKKLLLSFIILASLFTNKLSAQDLTKCEAIVSDIVKAINSKNSSGVTKYLADNFTTSGYEGEMAKMVIGQLIAQLNETITDFEKVSENKDNDLTLTYNLTYTNIGKKLSTFVFNTDNKVRIIELFKMEVKTLTLKDMQMQYPDDNIIQVPFKRFGNLLMTEALLNGTKRQFLIDNGAPILILNKRYTTKPDEPNTKNISGNKSLEGSTGAISDSEISTISNFDFNGITAQNQNILAINLEHLEKALKTEIYGLLGFSVYRNYDIMFDYEANMMTLIKPEYTQQFIKDNYSKLKYQEVPIEMNDHLASIEVKVANDILRMDIDCGAEGIEIDKRYFNKYKNHIKELKLDTLLGAGTNFSVDNAGILDKLKIGKKIFRNTDVAFSELPDGIKDRKKPRDGIIGFDMLSRQKTILSYKNKKLIFIE